MNWSWHSYDVDDDKNDVCSKTVVKDNGEVHRYDFTGGDSSVGHGHRVSKSMDDFVNDKTSYDRSPNSKSSRGRSWKD